jgi:hypothetical protein
MSAPSAIRRYALGIVLTISACSAIPTAPSGTASASPTPPASGSPSPSPTPPKAPPSGIASPQVSSPIVGVWHRTILCDEARKAFAAAGLLESHADWVCSPGGPPKPHSHFFTADGQFGSRDPGRVQVDDGDYTLVDARTLSFPSHSREFGYEPIIVRFALVNGRLTFAVQMPPECTAACADAYAWAQSAFGTNPWEAGDIP